MENLANIPIIPFSSQQRWREWLDKNHTQQTGIWLKIAKKVSGKKSVTYPEAVDEALCYGWIDGQKKTYDDLFYLQKFTPRRPRSMWSKVNVAKVASLIAAGKMHTAGLAEVKIAKDNGAWAAAYDSSSTLSTPQDFQTALDKSPKAKKFYLTLNKTNKYAFCWRIQTAKKPETRQARIEKFIYMLNKEEKLY